MDPRSVSPTDEEGAYDIDERKRARREPETAEQREECCRTRRQRDQARNSARRSEEQREERRRTLSQRDQARNSALRRRSKETDEQREERRRRRRERDRVRRASIRQQKSQENREARLGLPNIHYHQHHQQSLQPIAI